VAVSPIRTLAAGLKVLDAGRPTRRRRAPLAVAMRVLGGPR